MARAYPQSEPQDFAQSPGEWQALRGELVALLDQVESRVARQSRQDTTYVGLGDRLQDLRQQVADAEPDDRHREALRSVMRAVDRFSDRDESFERQMSPNPRDTLQSAIQQIRARQGVLAPRGSMTAPAPQPQAPAPQPPRLAELPQFTELAQAVGGISSRLERLEGELKTQARSQTGNVKEIAEQVAQLSHVVELLAGAVGETGQVKRLEGQIASLARMIAQGPQVDLSALTKRLDDVSATVGKLADLQVQYASKVQSSDRSNVVVEGMRAIEEGMRNVYDRIDAIERRSNEQIDLEPITRELGRITEAMKSPAQPQGLVELIDVLNQRINDLEIRSPDVSELKVDVELLRNVVIETMEPRFAAIELQIESLSDRISERPAEISVSQLEAQVRQLVARMDQTGEQLTGLAKLYQQPAAPAPAPDFEALAELVASRTSDALVRVDPPAAHAVETDYEEIEKRLARVMRAAAMEQAPPEDFSGMRSSIREVNERLARLEDSLVKRAEEARRIEAAPLASFTPAVPSMAPSAPAAAPVRRDDPIAKFIHDAEPMPAPAPALGPAVARVTVPPRRSDAMPANPAVEAPLTAKPFPEPTAGPVRSALDAKNGPRPHHPGLGEPAAPVAPPAYDPTVAAKPPRPVSSLDGVGDPVAAAKPAPRPAPTPAPEAPVVAEAAPEAMPSANTFIQAHRRAARQTSAMPTAKAEPAAAGAGSLIGRAMARLQGGATAAAPAAESATPHPDQAERKAARKLAGDKPPVGKAWTPDDAEPTGHVARVEAPEAPALAHEADDSAPSESFLTRYRRPILLAAVLVAATFLAGNLALQKLTEGAQAPAPAAVPASGDSGAADISSDLLDAQPIEKVSALSTPAPNRVIDMVDSIKTGSIDPMSTTPSTAKPMGFAPSTATPDLTASFGTAKTVPAVDAATELGTATGVDAPLAMPAPLETNTAAVTLELPPEQLGPIELRQAAANGDARAQFEVAAIYTEGRAVPEDPAAAAIWYERSAAQGFAPAQYRLGNLYENGRGVEKDVQQARLWYQRAAEAGNRMAMHNLAALYAGGELGKQQFDSAAEWFEQAANRGMKDSQFNLGMLYARGLGVKQDMLASFKWFSLAAGKGDKDAAQARDDIARSLSADDASRLAAEIAAWKPQSVDLAANFAPIGTWSAKFDPGEPIAKKEVVLNVQTALSQLGYDLGTPDGVAGPKTIEAIKAFERSTGMSESGTINPRLLAVLGSQPV
jgi:localization factor PodJL